MFTKIKIQIQKVIGQVKPLLMPAFCILLLTGLASFASRQHSGIVCNGSAVLLHPLEVSFIQDETIRMLLEKEGFTGLEGQRLRFLDLKEMEEVLQNHDHIGRAAVYAGHDGTLYFKVHQREPYYRVLRPGSDGYYVDKDRRRIPLSASYTYRTLVVTGHIPDEPEGSDSLTTKLSHEIYEVVDAINRDPFINSLAGELHVTRGGEFMVIPRVGNLKIFLGDTSRLPEKFRNLRAFYQQALPESGWDHYRTVNLKYKNQIIAKR